MKALVYSLAWAAALGAAASTVCSQPPSGTGRVLILDNGNALEGEVERQGDVYVIRRPLGELKIPAGKAAKVCASLEDAYKFLASRANLREASEHLRLARWCQTYGLHALAIGEARTAEKMQPENAELKQFLAMLERPGAAVTSIPLPAEKTEATSEPSSPLEVTSDCVALFSTKVQPILMNTCASCHANGRGGSFVLNRGGDLGAQKATQINLTATIKQINFEQSGASPLLVKACTAHGGEATAALTNSQMIPFATLQGWTEFVVGRNPHLKAQGSVLAKEKKVEGNSKAFAAPVLGQQPPTADSPIAREVQREISPGLSAGGTPNARPVTTVASPANPPEPARTQPIVDPVRAQNASPYDANDFNLKYHSPRQSGQ